MTDPRYDPRYQRGYVPTSEAVPERSTPPSPAAASAPAAPAAPAAAPLEEAPDVDARVDVDVDLDETAVDAPPHDPYRRALLIVSVVLIVVTAGLFWRYVQPQTPADSDDGFFLLNLVGAALPMCAPVGLLGIVFWIALGAVKRR